MEKGAEVGMKYTHIFILHDTFTYTSPVCYKQIPIYLKIGAHILSGAVIEPRALDELIPNWKEKGVSSIPNIYC